MDQVITSDTMGWVTIMNKICTNCNEPFKEYVPHNSLPGDANCEWICFDPNCSEETTKETTPGNQGGLIEWPNDWDVTWTALRAEIETEVLNRVLLGDRFYVTVSPAGVTLVVRQGVNRMFDYGVRGYPIPTRNAPTNAPQGSKANVPSSLKLHTQPMRFEVERKKAYGSQQISPALVGAALSGRIPPPPEDHPPRTLGTPTLLFESVLAQLPTQELKEFACMLYGVGLK